METKSAYARAIRLLSVKSRFKKELEERLRLEGFPESEIVQALAKCAPYLNDEELAKSKARVQARKGYGPNRIAASLKRYTSSNAAMSEVDEKEALVNYMKKHPKLFSDPKAKLRLFRRGFSKETIEAVLKISIDDL